MPALVGMAHLDKQDCKICVEKGGAVQERIQVDRTQMSASILCSLGLLQPHDGALFNNLWVKGWLNAAHCNAAK